MVSESEPVVNGVTEVKGETVIKESVVAVVAGEGGTAVAVNALPECLRSNQASAVRRLSPFDYPLKPARQRFEWLAGVHWDRGLT